MKSSPNWDADEGFFINPVHTDVMISGTSCETTQAWLRKPPDSFPDRQIQTVRPAIAEAPASGLRVTWFGHSMTLVEIDGVRVLTDPVFADRVSPSTLIGPLRFHFLPMDPSELPELDAIIISHRPEQAVLAEENRLTRHVQTESRGAKSFAAEILATTSSPYRGRVRRDSLADPGR